jgi:hypothetical protein
MVDFAVIGDVGDMVRHRRMHSQEAGDLVALLEFVDHVVEVHVGEAVAVIGQEHLFVLDVIAHGPKPAADIAPDAGVDHGDAPIFLTRPEHLDLGALDDAVAIGLGFVVEEEVLNRVGFVTEAEHEILVTVLAVIIHHMPEDRLVADRDHRFWDALGILTDARAQATAEKNDFHNPTQPVAWPARASR